MRLVCVSLALVLFSQPTLAQEKAVADFRLKDAAGKVWSLADCKDKKAIVVLFLGTQCPINNAYAPRLGELHKEYEPKGVQFLAVNANEHDTPKSIAEHAKAHKIAFPVLRDENHRVADNFGAQRTPEAFVLDAKLLVRYQGRIDDQFGIGYQRPEPTKRDLAAALDEVLAGKPVSHAKTAVAGCLIARKPQPKGAGKVTFAKDVSRILQSHCQECHRPGQIGPMPLLTYEDAAPWADMIREVVEEKRMPPWHADPRFGKFHNDRRLPKEAYETLLAWIDQGCPPGDAKDLPAPRKWTEGWSVGQPDVVFTMNRDFTVPAKATPQGVKYQHFVVPTNFDEDVWVQAAEAKPGNRAVVHHIIVYIVVGGKRDRGHVDGIGNGFLTAYTPGDFHAVFPLDAARKIPKGAALVFQMHYTPNGTEQTDRSSVGLVFAKKPPKHEVRSRAITQQIFLIPPGADNHRVTSRSTFTQDALLWSLTPHMHLRGKDFEYVAVFPDGKKETLLSVPRYDFNWQATYRLQPPLLLPAGTRIECTAHFDNSKNNPNNPDPTKIVRWGDQTWEEMMIGFADYTVLEPGKKTQSGER
ncbi:MAG: redoxin domain-containing protein [Gemmataceae bacterium]|nr:redoxin domain-containing protein [Gemmataceae bacterium]